MSKTQNPLAIVARSNLNLVFTPSPSLVESRSNVIDLVIARKLPFRANEKEKKRVGKLVSLERRRPMCLLFAHFPTAVSGRFPRSRTHLSLPSNVSLPGPCVSSLLPMGTRFGDESNYCASCVNRLY